MPPEEFDSLDAKSLKGLVLSLLGKIDELFEQNKKLLEQNSALLERIAELEGRGGGKPPKTPKNSSLPPSGGQKANVVGTSTKKKCRKGGTAVAHVIAPTRGKIVPIQFLNGMRPKVWLSDRLAAQCNHADEHQVCLAHLIRDAQYAIDAGDAVFAPPFKEFLERACGIGGRRPNLADSTMKAYARKLERELDRLLELEPTNAEGRHLRDAIIVDARDKLLVFMRHRDVEPTNNGSEQKLRPSVIFRKVTNCFRSEWGAKLYADLCSIVSTGRLHGRSPLAAIRDALTGRYEPATH